MKFLEWMKPNSKFCRFRYVIFVTNVRLSAQDGTGGLIRSPLSASDQIMIVGSPDGLPRTLRERGLREVRIWHRDYLNVLSRTIADVRAAFPMPLTVGADT